MGWVSSGLFYLVLELPPVCLGQLWWGAKHPATTVPVLNALAVAMALVLLFFRKFLHQRRGRKCWTVAIWSHLKAQ